MLESETIHPSRIYFSSLVLRKKYGSWCFTDYRALNEATIKDCFPVPPVDYMIDELHSDKYFTKLDLRAKYYQIRVQAEDVHKMAFRTHSKHYEYLVMYFGLCNDYLSFQATMNVFFTLLLRKYILVFFDGILIYSHS